MSAWIRKRRKINMLLETCFDVATYDYRGHYIDRLTAGSVVRASSIVIDKGGHAYAGFGNVYGYIRTRRHGVKSLRSLPRAEHKVKPKAPKSVAIKVKPAPVNKHFALKLAKAEAHPAARSWSLAAPTREQIEEAEALGKMLKEDMRDLPDAPGYSWEDAE